MQRASLLARGNVITAADLGLPAVPLRTTEPDLDKEAIQEALSRHAGVVAQAAAELGLSRQALYRRMERLGIGRPIAG
jgi:transcriptional regulator of acetoin/glycerol metabolism